MAANNENTDTLKYRNHTHNFFETHIVLSGHISYGFEDKTVTVKNGEYIMCGDNQATLENGITVNHILAKMKAVIRDGEVVDETNPQYRKYVKSLPRRRFSKKLRSRLSRIKNKIFKKKTV